MYQNTKRIVNFYQEKAIFMNSYNQTIKNYLMFQQYNHLFKIVVIGNSGVGKTNLVSQFVDSVFLLDQKPTVGVQFSSKTVRVNQNDIRCQIWDTAGQQRFRAVTKAYYNGAVGALVVFDLTSPHTFENISKWIEQVEQNTKFDTVILLIGNKDDLPNRAISPSTISTFLDKMGKPLIYMETSALTGSNVKQAFFKLIESIYFKKQKKIQLDKSRVDLRDSVPISQPSESPKSPRKQPIKLKSQNFLGQQPKDSSNPNPPKKHRKKCC